MLVVNRIRMPLVIPDGHLLLEACILSLRLIPQMD